MNFGLLKMLGQIAGIGGIALGVFLLLFRDCSSLSAPLLGTEAGVILQFWLLASMSSRYA
jgi:hypothetical protein